jgi:Tfp pilus assembly protein PilX
MMDAKIMRTARIFVAPRSYTRGISLLVVLIMLIIIGIASATAMRSATSEQRATNNIRMEAVAQQYAEAALRYCEGEMQKVDASRTVNLRAANIPTQAFGATGAWESAASWTGTGATSRVILTAAQISDANTAAAPTYPPECMVEMQTLSSTDATRTVAVVTARGFSPDYTRDSATGKTKSGAAVWLQSIINAN